MSAKDYQICPSLWNCYLAKVSKKNPNLMLDDRRVITDSEIYGLIEWKLKQRLVEEDGSTLMVCEDDKPIIQIRACGKLLREINKMRKENKEE